MTRKCIFQERFRYDPCRSCDGCNEGCPNYLGEFKHSKPITLDTRKSLGVEKLLEIASYETTNKVSREQTDPPTVPHMKGTHSESFNYLQHRRSILEPLLPRRNFLERFRRSQR